MPFKQEVRSILHVLSFIHLKVHLIYNSILIDCSLDLRGNVFAGNVAGIKGGALYYDSVLPEL